ncbi:MAG: twin-arginine translocase TatA/TatE family subunit [Myxococcota bacterium]
MGSLSPIHWIIVLVVVLLLFGPGRLAGVGKGLGEGIRAFKKGIGDDEPKPGEPEAKQIDAKVVETKTENKA